MTLVRDDPGLPAAHALVIGIGEYPWLAGGTQPLFASHGGMGQLTSAPASARRFCRWFLDECALPGVGNKTLDLLLSDPAGTDFVDAGGNAHAVDRATMANIRAAVLRWSGRADPGSVLFFFYCGHGLGKGKQTVLLAEDFGSLAGSLSLTLAVDFDQLYLGLDQSAARRQCYFVDACRVGTPFALNTLAYFGDPIVPPQARVAPQPRSAPVFYSAVPGAAAYGRAGQPSFFTDALLHAFAGAGADDVSGNWRVDTDSLHRGIFPHLRRAVARTAAQGQLSLVDGLANPFTLHELPARPLVPVEVTCAPAVHNATATLSVTDPTTPPPVLYPGPQQGWWDLELPFGDYRFDVTMPAPAASPPTVTRLVRPPYQRLEVPVP
jgi:hypothetical protein